MPTYHTPKRATAYKFYVGLTDQANTKLLKANPTLAAGDVKVSKDGGAFANLTTLPSANPAAGAALMVDLSGTEMTADNVVVQFTDAAGAEWCDQMINIQTTARQLDDLAYPATTGRSLLVDAAGAVPITTNLKKNQALANFHFLMTDSTTHNPATGKTVTVTRCIDGGAFGAGTLSAVTEVSNGMYRVDFAAADLNGNVVTLRATASGSDDLFVSLTLEP
ncbi:MAG: hypothetical protein Q8N51_05815 [Gammaproteobacteria bacterium]|nr:hypothetical protein [Gammaproteobacteria bacterium]